MNQIIVTKEQIQPIIRYNYDIEIDTETKEIIIDTIVGYINGFFKRFIPSNFLQYRPLNLDEWPENTSWEAAFPCMSDSLRDNETFAITKRNTSVVFEKRNGRIYVTEYSGYVIERW